MRLTLKVLSIIFSYPGKDLASLAGEAESLRVLLEGEDPEAARLIHEFLREVDPSRADEDYVSVFELPPKCSLYAHTYLLKGKEDMVGQFLLELKGHYKSKGLDVPVERELPSYLPVMLEYLALIYDEDPGLAARFARRYLAKWVGRLAECLERNRSPWAKPARALERVVGALASGRRG